MTSAQSAISSAAREEKEVCGASFRSAPHTARRFQLFCSCVKRAHAENDKTININHQTAIITQQCSGNKICPPDSHRIYKNIYLAETEKPQSLHSKSPPRRRELHCMRAEKMLLPDINDCVRTFDSFITKSISRLYPLLALLLFGLHLSSPLHAAYKLRHPFR